MCPDNLTYDWAETVRNFRFPPPPHPSKWWRKDHMQMTRSNLTYPLLLVPTIFQSNKAFQPTLMAFFFSLNSRIRTYPLNLIKVDPKSDQVLQSDRSFHKRDKAEWHTWQLWQCHLICWFPPHCDTCVSWFGKQLSVLISKFSIPSSLSVVFVFLKRRASR